MNHSPRRPPRIQPSLRGFEAMSMIRKGQIQRVEKGDVIG